MQTDLTLRIVVITVVAVAYEATFYELNFAPGTKKE
jgi:hypothetical protein